MQSLRRIDLIAVLDANVQDNLKALGYSSRICTALRKEMGLVNIIDNECLVPIPLPYRLNKGQKFCIFIHNVGSRLIPKYELPIDIVYEDDDLAVVNKPSGLAVISTGGHYGRSLENALANIWGSDFVYRPVNRLDRDTSGLMVVAKNQACHCLLSPQNIDRQYLALASGIMTDNIVIDEPISLVSPQGMMRQVAQDGKNATTIVEPIKQYYEQDYTLIKCTLLTGRTHQIRVHLAHIGHSLCCDKLYNPHNKAIILHNGKRLSRQALHSYKIKLVHPITNKEIALVADCEFCDDIDWDNI